ncbi:uncharacterized protein [Elaeis guineensis]|uniref:uncharacterized protein n=1 Tax=Elaeis guineensis var. tenera TaxID=51953 RepID=UPI003C6D9939
MKHINIRYHFVRDVVDDGLVSLLKIHTNANPTDVLTKSVARKKFNWSKASLGLRAREEWELGKASRDDILLTLGSHWDQRYQAYLSERRGASGSVRATHDFNNFVNSLGLLEINSTVRRFTWSNFTDQAILAKLDRCLVTLNWHNTFPTSSLSPLPRVTSDHIPLLLSLKSEDQRLSPLKKLFRFENIWYRYEGIDSLIKQWWSACPSAVEAASNLVLKLRNLRTNLKRWSKSTVGNITTRKIRIAAQINELDELEEQRNLNPAERSSRADLKLQLESILQQEEIMWHQRSCNTWLHEGDRNTKFFHISASNKMRRNRISEIFLDHTVLRSHVDIAQAFYSYYQSFLGTSGYMHIDLDWDKLYPPPSTSDLSYLAAPFSSDEIKSAIFSLAKNKSPGPDGFQISFYQKYWDVVSNDIIKLFASLHSGHCEFSRLNYTYISLIPKKSDNATVKDFRPISIENGLIKIISKVLSNRLQTKLDELVSDCQSAFIKGRHILESYISAVELISYSKRSNLPAILCKID